MYKEGSGQVGRLELVYILYNTSQPELFTLQNKALGENTLSVLPLLFSHGVHDKRVPRV